MRIIWVAAYELSMSYDTDGVYNKNELMRWQVYPGQVPHGMREDVFSNPHGCKTIPMHTHRDGLSSVSVLMFISFITKGSKG